jgi:HSP20 family protein
MFRSLKPFDRHTELDWADSFRSLQREMNRMFDDTSRGNAGNGGLLAPSMDVKETDKAIEVEVELPGVHEKDVQISFENGVLTVRGEKKTSRDETKGGQRITERSYGSFLRSLELPPVVDAEKITATSAKGVLKVMLPKRVEAQATSRKIEIKTAA